MVAMPEPGQPAVPLFEDSSIAKQARSHKRGVTPQFGDQVVYNTDILTFQVHDVYIDSLPVTMTDSQDVILFADVWENGASNLAKNDSLTSVVGISRNQMVPGRMNLSGRVIYGPTEFKGYPLTLRFTLMVLQKDKGQRVGSAADVLGSFASMIPTYGTVVSAALKGARDVLLSQPDIIAFDYEVTLLAESPEGLLKTTVSSTEALPTEMTPQVASAGMQAESWQIRMPWMRYGMYAVIETRSRSGRSPAQGDRREVTFVPPLAMKGGALVTAEGKEVPKYLTGAGDPLRHPPSTSIVFSITPGQRPVDPKALRAASADAQRQIEEVRQGGGDNPAGYKKIAEAAESIQGALLQTTLDDMARSVSMRATSLTDFRKKYDAGCSRISTVIGGVPRFSEISASIREKWEGVYSDVGGKEMDGNGSLDRNKAVAAKETAKESAQIAKLACESEKPLAQARDRVLKELEKYGKLKAESPDSEESSSAIDDAMVPFDNAVRQVFAAVSRAEGSAQIAREAAESAQSIAAKSAGDLVKVDDQDNSKRIQAASQSIEFARAAEAASVEAAEYARQAQSSRDKAIQMQMDIEKTRKRIQGDR